MSKREKFLINNPESAIGKLVYKPSGKPFKSGSKTNTVKSITTNPNTNRPAFTFIDDTSIVDVVQCELYEGEDCRHSFVSRDMLCSKCGLYFPETNQKHCE